MHQSALTLDSSLSSIRLRTQDEVSPSRGTRLFTSVLSLLVIAAVVYVMDGFSVRSLLAMVPTTPLFWLVFVLTYFVAPASEWVIFDRLWSLPRGSFFVLTRKIVYNELILGYLGEVFFYKWARQNMPSNVAPFGAVKDVAILSAMAGNAVTALLLAIVWPIMGSSRLGIESRPVVGSLAIVLLTSLVIMCFRQRLFSLPRRELKFALSMHFGRIALIGLGTALMWHLVLPAVPLSWWGLLVTIRMLISRLPLVPNKDLVFAGIAVVMLGSGTHVAALLAMMAGLILLAHMVVGSFFAVHDLIRKS